VYAGVAIDGDQVSFNWKSDDSSEDVLSLVEDMSGQYNEDGVRYIYGYEYNSSASSEQKKVFRNCIKHFDLTSNLYSDIFEFVDWAVVRLDSHYSLDNFSVTIRVESSKSPSLVDEIDAHISEYCRNLDVSFELLKKTYKDVSFDQDKALQVLLDSGYKRSRADYMIRRCLSQFERLKSSGELFQMKKFLPREIRSGFHDFLQFKSDEERELYETLQGVDVLIYDDFLTSGSTVKEIVRYLRSINDHNRLTVFVLVKQ